MNDTVLKDCSDLIYILNSNHELRNEILSAPVARIVWTFCEVILNILHGDLEANEAEKEIFIRQKSLLVTIAKDNQSLAKKTKCVSKLDPDVLTAVKTLLERYV